MQQVAAQPPPIFLAASFGLEPQPEAQVARWPGCPVAVIPEVVLAPPTSPGFYPHSEWAALGPVQVGVRFQAQTHH